MNATKIYASFLLFALAQVVKAQGYFSGDVQINNDYYIRDSSIGAANSPNYDYNKSSADGWFSLRYTNPEMQLEAGVRLDLFMNSILHRPPQTYTGYGIGNWFIRKKVGDLKVTAGNFYDQFGSGLAFRTFEERALGIDNAMLGIHTDYQLKNFHAKAFVAFPKYRFEIQKQFVKGINFEGNIPVKSVDFAPGIAVVNRTLDNDTRTQIKAEIDTYADSLKFLPVYNSYVFSAYNQLRYKNFSWFIEGAYKSKEAIYNSLPEVSKYVNKDGTAFYTTLSYSKKGLGITAQGRRTENFVHASNTKYTDNLNQYTNANLGFIAPTAKQHSLRLPARYIAAGQQFSEAAVSLDVTVSPIKNIAFNVSLAEIHNLQVSLADISKKELWNETMNYREVYVDAEFKKSKNGKLKGLVGFQYLKFNQLFYQQHGEKDLSVYSGFGELTYKMDKKHSLRFELQYQNTKKDFGEWIYTLVEYNVAPRWSFSVSDMWNFKPNKNNTDPYNQAGHHYYSFYGAFTHKQHRLSLAYVKQVAGIVCTGGVCRPEPAFSGVRAQLLTNF